MIYLAADIHGHIRLDRLKELLQPYAVTSNDYLIILGDAGIVWSDTEHKEVQSFYESLPLTTLFVDGNHENFDLLETYPVVDYLGGSAHKISDKIFHLMRGEIYTIDGKTFFTFGGGFSLKKLTNSSPVNVWEREMPNETEYQDGLKNLTKYNFKVDYILSHVAPRKIAYDMWIPLIDQEIELNNYLEEVRKRTTFKKWFFGHHHKDRDGENWSAIYDRILLLGE